jgi:DNA polymerase (family 10)
MTTDTNAPVCATDLTNKDVADLLRRIADLLQIKGEVIYKILAYRKAADGLMDLARDVKDVRAEGGLEGITGVGKAIAAKIDELLETGSLGFYEKLIAEVPESLAELMAVPDLGPKKIKLFWQEAGVTTLAELEAAAKEGKLSTLSGMGPKSEAKILEGLASLSRRTGRMKLGDALPVARELIETLGAIDGVVRVEAAGSLRRMRDTVGDLDLLAAAEDSAAVLEAFVGLDRVARVLGHGETKASVEFVDGTRAQLWVHPPNRFGTALQYATGSKDHNVRLREIALARGLSLSEHALKRVGGKMAGGSDGSETSAAPEMGDGDGDGAGDILCATEEEVYAALGLPVVPPELREDRGEVAAAAEGVLPERLEVAHIRSQLHNHSTWSDGRASIREMAEAAIERGYAVLAITDHSGGLGIVQGLDADGVRAQREELDAVREAVGDRILLLHGIEVDILADGTLDMPDEVLAELDVVVASPHVALRQKREDFTKRMLRAVRHPQVDIIGHPTGRRLNIREAADLDMDAFFAAAVETGTALEINANPQRLDLNDIYARRAIELGIPLSINTDAHAPDHFDFLEYGVATARRGWVEPEQVINTWATERLLEWLGRAKG